MRNTSGLVLGILCAVASCVTARPSCPLDLGRALQISDAVCTGQVLERNARPSAANEPVAMTLSFRVDRVLKGNLVSGDTIVITYAESNEGLWRDQQTTDYDLVLLRKAGTSYAFTLPADSTMPVAKKAYSQYSASSDPRKNTEWEIANSLKDASPRVVRAALQQTRLLSKQSISTFVEPLTASTDPDIRVYALSGLASAGNWRPGLEYLSAKADSDLRHGPIVELKMEIMLARIMPSDVPVVSKVLQSPSSELREIGSYILRQSACAESLPYLRSALDDSAAEVQYNAMMGLASFARDSEHATTYEAFLKDKSAYLTYWKHKPGN